MKTKAKRRLTDIKFDHDAAHVALVGKQVGGAANGYTTLITKAVEDLPEEVAEKAAQVRVTMEFDDFLCKFFNMYYEDAEVLARLLGFESEEMPSDMYDYQGEHRRYIQERVDAIEIMKAVAVATDMKKALSELSYTDSLAVLKAQEQFEEAMSSANAEGDNKEANVSLDSPSTNGETMDVILKAMHDELVQKAVTEAQDVLKAKIVEVEAVLKAAQDELNVFKAREAAAVEKARKDALIAVLPEGEVEEMFKAVGALPAESFDIIVKNLAAKAQQLEQSDLFKEAGVSGAAEQDQAAVDGTAAILKAKYHAAKR